MGDTCESLDTANCGLRLVNGPIGKSLPRRSLCTFAGCTAPCCTLMCLQSRTFTGAATTKTEDFHADDNGPDLHTHSKHFIDAIEMIAHRTETAMANALRESLTRADEARTLLRALYATEADLLPDLQSKTLTVRLHHRAQQRSDQAVAGLCAELNQTRTVVPRTELRMIFVLATTPHAFTNEITQCESVSSQNLRDQGV